MMFRRIFKIVLIMAVFGFIGIQFIRLERTLSPFASGGIPPGVCSIIGHRLL
jgi:hypothetical protein